MAVWRPTQRIRNLVIALVWRRDHLLVAEVEDDAGQVKGFRPLGGGVEFGERREEALAREFREELDCEIKLLGPWVGVENIYTHEGEVGHEMVFAVPVKLMDPSVYERDSFRFSEDSGQVCLARWVNPFALPEGVALYPDDLLTHLVKPFF